MTRRNKGMTRKQELETQSATLYETNNADELNIGFYPDGVRPSTHPDLVGSHATQVERGQAPLTPNAPTTGETWSANFRQFNAPYRASKALQEDDFNPFNKRLGWDEGYDPVEEGKLDDIPSEFWGAVLGASNAKDADKVRAKIFDEMVDIDIRDRSGWFANLTSTLGATIADPTILIPVSQTVKYARFGTGILKNAARTGGTLFPQIALQNTVLSGTKATEDFQDWAYNTMAETLFASAFGGALGAFATKGAKAEQKGMKAFFGAVKDDIEVKYDLLPDGSVGKPIARPMYSGVGAAEVENVQAILDSISPAYFKNNWLANNMFTRWGAPVIEGLTSKFSVFRDFTDKLMPHPFRLAQGDLDKVGMPSARDFVKLWDGKRAQAQVFGHSQWLDYIGIKGGAKNVRAAAGEWTGKHISEAEFNELVTKSIRRNAQTGIGQVDRAAKVWLDEVYKPLFEEAQKRFPGLKGQEFTNIVNYVNRAYDKEKIVQDPEGFFGDVVNYVTETNDKVRRLRNQRIRLKNQLVRSQKGIKALDKVGKTSELQAISAKSKELRAQRKEIDANIKQAQEAQKEYSQSQVENFLKKREAIDQELDTILRQREKMVNDLRKINASDAEIANQRGILQLQEAEQRKALEAYDQKVNEQILSGEITPDMLQEKMVYTAEELKLIEDLSKPIKNLEAKLTEAIEERRIASEKEDYDFNTKAKLDEKVKGIREQLKNERGNLSARIESEGVAGNLYRKTKKGQNVLVNPDELPKIRRTLNLQDIHDVAGSVRDNVLQLNEEQIAGAIFDAVKGGGNDIMKSRTLLWNDAYAEKWLLNDINTLSGIYTDQLSKRTYFQDLLESYGAKDFTGIASELKYEYGLLRKQALKIADPEAQKKALSKLDADFRRTEKQMGKMYTMYMGNYVDRSTGVYRTVNAVKQFGAGTLLGNVPILQLSEFFTPLLKFMVSEYVADGVIPAISRMKSVMSGKAKELGGLQGGYVRGAFADLGLGLNVATGARMQAMFGYGAQYQPKTIVEKYTTNLASLSQSVNLSNLLSDMQETTVAFASQSKTIRVLKKYLNGEQLNKWEIGRLDEIKLNPKEWASRITEQYKKHGEEIDGAFIANFHQWDDRAAADMFRISVSKEVRGIILRPDLVDQPYAFRDPLLSMVTQFTSWIFTATLNYTAPILTDFDTQKMVGILAMIGSASMIDPIRQLAKGEEVDLSLPAISTSALANSGVLGWQWDALQRLNARIDMPILSKLQPDRYKRKAFGALDLGPASGLADMGNNIISALVNGEMNQKDAQRAFRLLVPFSGTWFLRQPVDKMIGQFGLPKTRKEAKERKE